MKLTVREAMKFNQLSKLQLIAGRSGLDREIRSVGFLDYESLDELSGNFQKGDFILTSFYNMKDRHDLLIEYLMKFNEMEIAGIAVKKAVFKGFPDEIVEYCNKNGMPLFMCDQEVWFDSIIMEIVNYLKNDENNDYLASKIYSILNSDLSRELMEKISLEINPSFRDIVRVLYFGNLENPKHIMSTINNGPYRKLTTRALVFEKGVLIILSDKKDPAADKFLSKFNFILNGYFCGISESYNLYDINMAIREALYTYQLQDLTKDKQMAFEDIGIYKIIKPLEKNRWFRKFADSILEPILEYDREYDGNLMETAVSFVVNQGDFRKTSNELFHHINTIRYRISKIYEITRIEGARTGNYEQLAISIYYYISKNPVADILSEEVER
ncbi:PucR C-terminal helix-turn-helix domain-containing protein [Dethiosulfatibacter aminovorans DSM 17477]|uniref:PucR C-terminal helix-turn-helix domain-containing protein n=1 Tax=Dethiosulfatibacter aminovorans DSM 17477 TaxID=1121476 RepID=A0A1M6ACH4_9FIRM|nr:PucR family transcriptional regulator [Dethiosulfatibacter aminovorans]SHI34192.1 PucR C-terminal helix-turn-helix domain-containing protein [Dethiosulfatibacter aminovorans DSM 17477]